MINKAIPQPKILNSRYSGATPRMATRAFARMGNGGKPRNSKASVKIKSGGRF